MLFLLSTSLVAANIKIAVAANVSYAVPELIKAFEVLHPDIKVDVILGSSGKLVAQITHGAPYQLFMSADMVFPERLYAQKLATTKPVVYAVGALAILSVKPVDFTQGLGLLKATRFSKIAVANPKTAPYGVAAKEAMQKAGIYQEVFQKFVFAESISQTLSYVVSATDIGIVAKSSLFAPKMKKFKEGVHWKEVQKELYTPISQGMVILSSGKNSEDVKAFYDFILSEKAGTIFRAYGYQKP